jgi:cell division protein FtsN
MKPQPYNRRKRFFFELSRTQLLLSITGVLFILVWVFILGIIVGRGYVSDTITHTFNSQIQKLQEEKKTLLNKYLAQEKKTGIPEDEIMKPNNLDFYDDLSQKGKGTAHLTAPPQTVRPPGETAPIEVKASLPESKVTSESRESKENAGKTESFMVQVGAYREESTAQSSLKRLHEKKYQVTLKTKENPDKGGKWFRVQMGPFTTKAEAEKWVKKLEHDGFQALVVPTH